MTSDQRDRDETRPKRQSDIQIVIALFAGSLLTLLIVFVLFGRSLMSLSAPSPTPTLAPTPTLITSSAVVQQIQRLSRLETSSYSIQSVVSAERPGGLLGIGRQKVLVIVQGTVIAGIDLGKLRPEDVTISPSGKQVTVKLPEAEILSRYLDEGATRVYDHQTGLFTQPDSSLVVEAEQMGMNRVMQAACEGGIMKRATDDGQKALREFLRAVGFEVVQFEDAPIPACPEDI
jgi:Protein of unknown function (DUF4230)